MVGKEASRPLWSLVGEETYICFCPLWGVSVWEHSHLATSPNSLHRFLHQYPRLFIVFHQHHRAPNALNWKDMDIYIWRNQKSKKSEDEFSWDELSYCHHLHWWEKSTWCIRIRFRVDNQDPRCILGCCWIIRPKRAIWGWSLAYLILLRLGYLLL